MKITHLTAIVVLVLSIFAMIPSSVEATGWSGCTWSSDPPREVVVDGNHQLWAKARFSCPSGGHRILYGEIRQNFSISPDDRIVLKRWEFNSASGAVVNIIKVNCTDRRYSSDFFSKAWLVNPDTGNKSSSYTSSKSSVSIRC